MMQVLYFYISETRRVKVVQLDSVATMTEQQLRVSFGPGQGSWQDGKTWQGIAVQEGGVQSEGIPDNARTT